VTSNVHLFVFLSILACYSASGLLENKSFRSEDIALQRNMFRKPTFDVIVSDALLCFRHSYSQARVIKFLLFDLTVCFISTLVKHIFFKISHFVLTSRQEVTIMATTILFSMIFIV